MDINNTSSHQSEISEAMELDEMHFEKFLVDSSTLNTRKSHSIKDAVDLVKNAELRRQLYSLQSSMARQSTESKESHLHTLASKYIEAYRKHRKKQRQLPLCPPSKTLNENMGKDELTKRTKKICKLKDMNKSEFLSRSLDSDARHHNSRFDQVSRSASGSLKRRSYSNVADSRYDFFRNDFSSNSIDREVTYYSFGLKSQNLHGCFYSEKDLQSIGMDSLSKFNEHLDFQTNTVPKSFDCHTTTTSDEKRRKIESSIEKHRETNLIKDDSVNEILKCVNDNLEEDCEVSLQNEFVNVNKSKESELNNFQALGDHVNDIIQHSIDSKSEVNSAVKGFECDVGETNLLSERDTDCKSLLVIEKDNIETSGHIDHLNAFSSPKQNNRKPKLAETRRQSVFNKFKNSIRNNSKISKNSTLSRERSPDPHKKKILASEDENYETSSSTSTNSPSSLLRYKLFRNFTEPSRCLPDTPKVSTGELTRKSLWRTNSEPIPNFKEKKSSKSLYDDLKSRFSKKNRREDKIVEEHDIFDENEYKKYQQALQRGRRAAVFSLEINQCISVTKTSINNESYCQFNFISQNANPLLH